MRDGVYRRRGLGVIPGRTRIWRSDKTQHSGSRGRGSGDGRHARVFAQQPGKGGTGKFYEKGSVRIHYEEAGSGFPLMLLPGGGLNFDHSLLRRQLALQRH